MERKPERKWKTLRSLASPETVEADSDSVPEPDVPIPVEPKAPEAAGASKQAHVSISVTADRQAESIEPVISEDREWVGPESDSVVEKDLPLQESAPLHGENDAADEVAVFEALEQDQPFFQTAVSSGGPPVQEPEVEKGNRILVAHEVVSTSRLIRETLENFTDAKVDTTSDPVRAFELALQKPYRRFYFAMEVGELTGQMLYELISKAYTNGRAAGTLAPGVVFIREKEDPQLSPELTRDARVKDTISKPIRIDRLLKSVEDIFEVRDPTVK